jgi:hypothetical protein
MNTNRNTKALWEANDIYLCGPTAKVPERAARHILGDKNYDASPPKSELHITL